MNSPEHTNSNQNRKSRVAAMEVKEMGKTNWYCIITPTGFRHITSNFQAVMDALEMGWEVWHNQKRMA